MSKLETLFFVGLTVAIILYHQICVRIEPFKFKTACRKETHCITFIVLVLSKQEQTCVSKLKQEKILKKLLYVISGDWTGIHEVGPMEESDSEAGNFVLFSA